MSKERLHQFDQAGGRRVSPWPLKVRLKVLLWGIVWTWLFRPSLNKGAHRWRAFLLRLFGAQITGRGFVSCTAVIKMPWNLTLEDRACIGDHAEIYNLAPVTLKERAVIAQQVYLCCGTHDLSHPETPLVVGEIVCGADSFVGVRALILPGVHVGTGTVIGAGSVVTKDMPDWMICAGNPCQPLKPRVMTTPEK